MKYYYGVDLSHYQPNVDFKKLKQDFVFHKCTEGTKYIDPLYKERKEFLTGAYHFASGGDAIKECDWFLKNADTKKTLILDWEIEHADPVGWCKKFINRVKEKTGQDCWLYTNDARALKYNFPKDWKFWLARYKDYTGVLDWNYQPKAKWDIWQYSSRGQVSGITGNVDRNVSKSILGANSVATSDLTPQDTSMVTSPIETLETQYTQATAQSQGFETQADGIITTTMEKHELKSEKDVIDNLIIKILNWIKSLFK